MDQPLSTSAQLVMLAEGLDGDPAPARAELGLSTAPFTVTRLRPLLAKTDRAAPFSLRLFSGPGPEQEVSATTFWLMLIFGVCALTFIFGGIGDRWTGMTIAMGAVVVSGLFMRSVRNRLKPFLFRIVTGIIAGAILYAVTRALVFMVLPRIWPEWQRSARALYALKTWHATSLMAITLVVIVFGEEVLWRGIVARFLMERWGRAPGVVLAAAVYALAHWAALNPLLLLAAFGCGLYWGWLYASTDDLIVPGISHLLWDVLLLFLFPVVR